MVISTNQQKLILLCYRHIQMVTIQHSVYQSSRLFAQTSIQWLVPNVFHRKIEKGMGDFTKILRSSRRDF
jgi:hypothetical protein